MSDYTPKSRNTLPIIFDDRMRVNNLIPKIVNRVNDNTEDLTNLYEETEAMQEDVAGKIDAPETAGIAGQVLTTDGTGGTAWTTVGTGEIVVDPTLSIQGAAADAKATGDQLTLVKQDISELERGRQSENPQNSIIVENQIIDPDFKDITNTNKITFTYFTSKNAVDGVVTATKTSSGQARAEIKCNSLPNYHITYVSVWVKFTPSSGIIENGVAYVSCRGGKHLLTQDDYDTWIKVSFIGAVSNNNATITIGITNSNSSPSYTISFKQPFVADMTNIFGVGNELTLDEANIFFKNLYERKDITTTNVLTSTLKKISDDINLFIAENIFPSSGNYYSPVTYTSNKNNFTWNTYEWSDVVAHKTGDGTKTDITFGTSVFNADNTYAQSVDSENGDLYYFGFMVKTNVQCEYAVIAASNTPLTASRKEIYYPVENTWCHMSKIEKFGGNTYLKGAVVYSDTTSQSLATVEYKCGMCVNLTKTFGAGNEPSKDQMDILLLQFDSYWFTGRRPLFYSNVLQLLNNSFKVSPYWNSKYGYDEEGTFRCLSHVDKDWSGWKNGRYSYGQNNKKNKIYSEFDQSIVSDGMFISDGKTGAWTTEGSGQNTYGGHVFQGWNEIGTYRLTLMIGNTKVGGTSREDEAAILVYSPNNCFNNPNQELTNWQQENRITPQSRDYYGGNSQLILGRIRIGSDLHAEGLLVERKRFTHFGDIVQTSDGVTFRKLQFNNDGSVTWVDCTNEMNDPS